MTVAGRYEFDPTEHYRALRAMVRFNRARWLVPFFGIVVPTVAIWAFVIRDWDKLSLTGVLLNGLPWVFLGAFYLSMIPVMFRVIARRALRDDPSLRGTQTRIVSDDGLEVQGVNLVQRLTWPDIVRAEETTEFFLFFYNRRVAHYVPKRCLTDGDVDAIRSLVSLRGPK